MSANQQETVASASGSGGGSLYPKIEQEDAKKWGTYVMGAPAEPSAHPHNKEAAANWTPRDSDEQPAALPAPSPYVHTEPVSQSKSPMESVLQSFNKWTKKAEDMAVNVWTNLKTGQKVPETAWGKLSLGAKALTEGGFEALFRHTFPVAPDEKLRKTFACYLSTSTGPVAGTIYLSTANICFCSDRPLSVTLPSGEQSWTYYRVVIPLEKVKEVNASTSKENPQEKYIQIVTVDDHDFWFMGFVNYDKAMTHLSSAISNPGCT